MIESDIHPTSTAGTGKLDSRRTTYKRGDLISDLRRCAQCGMFNRTEQEIIAESQESPGVQHQTISVTVNLDSHKLPQPLKGMSKFSQTSVSFNDQQVTSGCRFCGSLNSIGMDRDLRDYGTGVDLSNK